MHPEFQSGLADAMLSFACYFCAVEGRRHNFSWAFKMAMAMGNGGIMRREQGISLAIFIVAYIA